MSNAAEIAKELDIKIQDVKAIATGLKLNIDEIKPEQREGLTQAIALVKGGKSIEEACQEVLSKAKGEITPTAPAQVQPKSTNPKPVASTKPNTGENIPENLRQGIDTIAKEQAKEEVPNIIEQVAKALNMTTEQTSKAIAGYASHALQEELAKNLNSPEFASELRAIIQSGKSQTSAKN